MSSKENFIHTAREEYFDFIVKELESFKLFLQDSIQEGLADSNIVLLTEKNDADPKLMAYVFIQDALETFIELLEK